MKDEKNQQPSSTSSGSWTGTQAYVLAAFCLLLGVALGYLFRGSASPSAQVSAATTAEQTGASNQQQPSADMQAAMAQAAAPLLEAVNRIQTITIRW